MQTYIWNDAETDDYFSKIILKRTEQFASIDNVSVPLPILDKFTDIISDAYNNNYDCIEVIRCGTFCRSCYSDRIKIVETLEFDCYAHILHTGLWNSVKDPNFFTLHEQYIILKKPAIDILYGKDLDSEFKNSDCWPNIERSVDNVHDDYTPIWIRKKDNDVIRVSKGKSKFGKLEKVIEYLCSNDILIMNIPKVLRRTYCYSYYADGNNKELLQNWASKSLSEIEQNKDIIGPSVYEFLKKMNYDKSLWAYNTEKSVANNLYFDTLIAPAAGLIPFKYILNNNYKGKVKVDIIDINEHTLELSKWLFTVWQPTMEQNWSDVIQDFLAYYKKDVVIAGNVESTNLDYNNIKYNLIKNWQSIKDNILPSFTQTNIIEDRNYVRELLKNAVCPFIHLSNCFRYNSTFYKDYDNIKVKDYINFLYSSNSRVEYKIILPDSTRICYSNKINYKPKVFYKEVKIPSMPIDGMLKEFQILEEKLLFTKHRGDIHPGWESFVLHGLGYDKTEAYERYGYENDNDAPHDWTKEALENCPITVKYFQENKLRKKYFRVRVMKLAPNGYINIHDDDPNKHRTQWALNIAVNHPKGCEMHFWDNDLIYQGQVPWVPGMANEIRVHYNHMVRNLSDTTRYHIIVHGIR